MDDLCNVLRSALQRDSLLIHTGVGVELAADVQALLSDHVIRRIADQADGDARMALNILETCCQFVASQTDK